MFRHPAPLAALIGLAVFDGNPDRRASAADPVPPPVRVIPEPLPMGYASLYGAPPGWLVTGWGYWSGWEPAGYGLCWRPAHDGGSYPCWWAGPAVVLGPWPPPALPAVAVGVPVGPVGGGLPADGIRRPASAAELYDRGHAAYWAGDYARAVSLLGEAAGRGDDPRPWYFLALSHAARGNRADADAAARRGAALDILRPGLTGEALERVQGPARAVLSRARDGVPDTATALAVLSAGADSAVPAAPPPTRVSVR